MTTTPFESGGAGIFGGTGPSVSVGGWSPEDPRSPCTSINGTMTGLLFPQPFVTVNVVPATLAANNIATAQVPVAAAPLTLTAGTGVTLSAGSLYMDGIPAANASSDITKLLTRCIRIVSVGNDSAATAAIVGLDEYGVVVHETLTLSNATTATSVKTYKAITSITPAGTLSGSNVTVGTTDTVGFPLRADEWGDVLINMNAALVTASTGFTAADATTATATTGATRGKYTLQSASDATKRLVIWQYAKSFTTVATLFGVTQF